MTKLIPFLLCFISLSANSTVKRWTGENEAIQEDIELVLKKAGWDKGQVSFKFSSGAENTVSVQCESSGIRLNVESLPEEKVSTIYHGLFKLGFLFPHPRWQISPSYTEARQKCGNTYQWRPAFSFRGFHLHTLHPNEWVKGFLEGKTEIALDFVRWMARNRQNAFQIILLRPRWKEQIDNVAPAFELARRLGVSRGFANGAANQQQNHWQFVPIFNAISGLGDERILRKRMERLNQSVDFDYYAMEYGTTEFTAVRYETALRWMEITNDIAQEQGKKLFAKIHVSTNQVHPSYGNFNFLVRYASPDIGAQPHTVMFYGLYDEKVPMYGNDNFSHMLKFIQQEKGKRDIWYFPETSYWIGMDVDVPLLLTDYLLTRAQDMEGLHKEGIQGHMNFTTGHELGYWLFDWTLTLNTDLDQDFHPLSGLKLLGENSKDWGTLTSFQTRHFKDEQLIAVLSGPNLQDEIAKGHRIHERHIMKEVVKSSFIREEEIHKLEAAIGDWPQITVQNVELKKMLEVTFLRMQHALHVRRALRYARKSPEWKAELNLAKEERIKALSIMGSLKADFSRYPEANLYERDKNVTSYNFNYLWTAGNLHFWKREEEQVSKGKYHPFFMNIYNFIDIIF